MKLKLVLELLAKWHQKFTTNKLILMRVIVILWGLHSFKFLKEFEKIFKIKNNFVVHMEDLDLVMSKLKSIMSKKFLKE